MSNGGDERDELQEYRARVLDEVVRRSEVLKRLEAEVAAAEHSVESAENEMAVPLGNTTKLQQREAFKATLKKKRDALLSQRRTARQDLERAEERLAEVDERIREASRHGLGVLESVSEDEVSD